MSKKTKAPVSEPLEMRFKTESDWLDARHARITASDCAVIMGSPKHLEWARRDNPGVDPVIALWESKRRPREDRHKSIVMRMGLAMEPLIAELWQEVHTDWKLIKPYAEGPQKFGFHCRGKDGWASATLDWFGVDPNGVQIVIDGKTGMYGKGNFMETYYWPCRWQMYVTDLDVCQLACLQKAKAEFWIEATERKGYDEGAMVKRCTEFYEFVQSGTQPPMDWIYPPEF